MEYSLKQLKNYIPLSKRDIIDEEMIPILCELNSKGYKTKFCCQGHTEEEHLNRTNVYIVFADNYDFAIDYPSIERKGNKKYTKKVVRNNNLRLPLTLYFYTSRKTSVEQQEKERQEFIKSIFEWSKALPSIL